MSESPSGGSGLALLKVLFFLEAALFIFYSGCSILFQFSVFSGDLSLNPFLFPVPFMALWIWGCVRQMRRMREKNDEAARRAFTSLVLTATLLLIVPLLIILASSFR